MVHIPRRVACSVFLVLLLLPASSAAASPSTPVAVDATTNATETTLNQRVGIDDANETADESNATGDVTTDATVETRIGATAESEDGNTSLPTSGSVDASVEDAGAVTGGRASTVGTEIEELPSNEATPRTATAATTQTPDGRADADRRDGDRTRSAPSSRWTADANGSVTTGATTSALPSSNGSSSGSSPDGFGVAVASVAVAGVAAGGLVRDGTPVVLDGSLSVETAKHSVVHARQILRACLPRVVLLVGYSRSDDSDPLEHDVRAALREAVLAKPGTHLSRLADRSAVSLSTVRYHLDVLADEGLVRSELIQGKRCYFGPDVDDVSLAAALEDAATESVVTTLASTGPSTVTELAAAMDLDPSTVSHHLSRLADDRIVQRERDGRRVVTSLTPAVSRALGADDGPERPVPSDD